MEMSNATQAGPTHGLLDLIFGTAEKADKESEEAQMDPIAALVAALEKQGKKEEEESSEISWAEMEAASATRPASDPGFNPPINTVASPEAKAMAESTAPANSGLDAAVLEAAGGNAAMAALLQKMNPNPEALRAIKNGDAAAVMKLIENRKAELRGQMPALGLLEKAIEKDGLEKVVGTGSLQQLVAKYEEQLANQGKIRKGSSTEDFLASKGLKLAAATEVAKATEAEAALADAIAPFGSSGGSTAALAGEGAATVNSGFVDAATTAESKVAADAKLGAKTAVMNPGTAMPVGGARREAESGTEENPAQQQQQLKEVVALKPTDAKGGAEAKLFDSAAAGAVAQTAAAEVPANGVYESIPVGDARGDELRDAAMPRLSHNISYIARRGGGQITMTINPKELGEIQLKVVTKGNEVEVKILAQNADVANALRSGSGELADALGAQKLNVAGIEISVKPGMGGGDNPLSQGGQQGAFANLNEGAPESFAKGREGFAEDKAGQGKREEARPEQQAGDSRSQSERRGVKRGPNGSIDLNA